MNETTARRRNPLSRVMTIYCVLFATFFALSTGLVSSYLYEQDMMARYHAYTRDLLNYTAAAIDGDDLKRCMETGVKSEKYHRLQELTNALKETHDVEFLYIIKPISDTPPDNMMDVLAAYTQTEKETELDELTDLGKFTGDAYPPKVAREYLARMDRNPEITFFPNDTAFGDIYTAIRPIFDSQGRPIAVLCADVLMDDINTGRRRFFLASIALALLLAVLLVAAMSYWLRRRVARPIERIKNSAEAMAAKCHNSSALTLFAFEDPGIRTNDELEDLSRAVATMCNEIKGYADKLIHANQQVGELQESFVKMDYLAYRDVLTGAGNKAAYERSAARLTLELQRGKGDFTLVMADLNYLKRINDNYGHDCGNKYIIGLHKILKQCFPGGEIFRIGGDEFVIILKGAVSLQAEKMLKKAKKNMGRLGEDKSLPPWEQISCAMGLCHYDPARHKKVVDVFNEADACMYQDKKKMRAEREDAR